MKKIHFVITLIILVSACSGEETNITSLIDSETVQGEFFANLFERCRETFSCEASYPDDPDHELVGVNLLATIQTCTEAEIWIALNAGGGLSRTWVISCTDDGFI